ncbi:MAG: hypothetical protein K6E29_04715 [Cyanobacteria bacterium RUI128]|nr:hypothetical protein [Cyanobacteria bacterium RUI128]
MIRRINVNPDYIPPKSLGEGLKRVKDAMGCAECIAKDIKTRTRLYKTHDGSTAYFTHAELHKTGKVLPEDAPYSHLDCDTFAGTAIRIKRSDTCANKKTKPNQVMQLMKVKFLSDKVKDAAGAESKPIQAITNFKIIKSEEGTPIVEYFGKRKAAGEIPNQVKEINPKDIPTENKEFKMPDGNIVYYLKDTIQNGKRAVLMKMYEAGIEVPIL